MFDTISNVQVKCPRCGDEGPKSVQIKCGPQTLKDYEFGKDRIEVDWSYTYYGSIIDEEKKVIRGIATCDRCEEESKMEMERLIQEAKDKGELKKPEGAIYLLECKIDGKSALGVVLDRLRKIYGGNRDIELFDIAIQLNKDDVPIFAGTIIEGSLKDTEKGQEKDTEKKVKEVKDVIEKLDIEPVDSG